MTTDEMNMAIWNYLGWIEDEPWLDGRRCFIKKGSPAHIGYEISDLPDCANDLNALFQFEKDCGLHRNDFHGRKLKRTWKKHAVNLEYDESFCNVRQRCELMLRTLNLYK